MVCPFVDTYADYMLRGEALNRDYMDLLYLRYVVSCYNVSNSVGTLCYDTCRIDAQTIRALLAVNARLPFWTGQQVAYSAASQPIPGHDYCLHPEERQLYLEQYLPAAARITDERAYTALAREWMPRVRAYARELAARRQRDLAALKAYVDARKRQHGAEASANLAAFKPAQCSEVTWTEPGLHGLGDRAEYATDANNDTYWAADFAPQWVQVDLQRVETIGRVVVRNYSRDKRYYHYDVQISMDQRRWQTVARKENDTLAAAAGDTYTFAPQPARSVRVLMRHNSANVGLHVVELEVYR